MCAKMILDREKSAAIIEAATTAFAVHVADGLRSLLEPELAAGETLPDLEHLQILLGRALMRRRRALVASQEELLTAQEAASTGRAARDAASRQLYGKLTDLRAALSATYGAEPVSTWLGLRGDTARDPLALLRQADRARARLRDPHRSPPPPRVPLLAAAPEAWAAHLDAEAEALRQALEEVGEHTKKVDDALCEKARTLATFDDAFVHIAANLEALYRLAGKPGLARGVRPSRRRPGRTLREVKQRRPRPRRKAPPVAPRSPIADPSLEALETAGNADSSAGNAVMVSPRPQAAPRLLPFAPLRRAFGRLGQLRRTG